MPNNHLQKLQEHIAKMFGTRRIGVPKSGELSDDYFKQTALFAKRIQIYAKDMGYTTLADIARRYKIDIKNAYTDYRKKLKECGYAGKSEHELSDIDKIAIDTLNSNYYEYVLQLATALAKIVEEQTQNMVNIYSDVYEFTSHIYSHNPKTNIKMPSVTSGNIVDNPNMEDHSPTPILITKPKYNPVPKPVI